MLISAAVVALACSFQYSTVALADGKMMIYPYEWQQQGQAERYKPIPYQAKDLYETEVKEKRALRTAHAPVPPPCSVTPKGFVPSPIQPPQSQSQVPQNEKATLPPWYDEKYSEEIPQPVDRINIEDGVRYGTFIETHQRAIIAWNGFEDERGEETLILTTQGVASSVSGGAMLSVIPLPGEPITIEQSDKEVFKKTKRLLYNKFNAAGSGGGYFIEPVIPHNIFVLKLDNIQTFNNEVNAYIAYKYSGKAAPLIDMKTEKIIGEYIKRGFRYFAFDLTEVHQKQLYKTILYRFKSTSVYYPLQISGIGGTSTSTAVDLIVITPDLIEVTCGAVKIGDGVNDVRVIGMKTVEFTQSEVVDLDKALATVFKRGETSLKVRNFYFDGTLNGYNSDFIAK